MEVLQGIELPANGKEELRVKVGLEREVIDIPKGLINVSNFLMRPASS